MQVHIGRIIEERLREVGMKKSELARRINKARQNINDILNRKSMDTELLYSISVALDYDFFQHYVMELNNSDVISEPGGEYSKLRDNINEVEKNLMLAEKDLENCQNETRLQKEIIQLLKDSLKRD